MEFKRKLDDEIKLKRLISQSIVVPVVEQDEVFGEESGPQVHHVEQHHPQQIMRQMDEGAVGAHDDPLGQESVVAEEIIGEVIFLLGTLVARRELLERFVVFSDISIKDMFKIRR